MKEFGEVSFVEGDETEENRKKCIELCKKSMEKAHRIHGFETDSVVFGEPKYDSYIWGWAFDPKIKSGYACHWKANKFGGY